MTADRHSDELAVELDDGFWSDFVTARNKAEEWKRRAEELRSTLITILGDAHAGLVAGRKVVSFRPRQQWAEAQLIQKYPDLTQHYMRPRVIEVFDLPAFILVHPDIAEEFRVRALRVEIEK